MESRFLSYGATAISGIPRLIKPLAKINIIVVSLPASLNTDGDNIVWGRQLRPSLLNLDYCSVVPLVAIPLDEIGCLYLNLKT
ncbi:hypothetical protein L1887_22719 [Cichorium endivia]|nr:hypothetical protein L1887_22719 [Cichorium endivia]